MYRKNVSVSVSVSVSCTVNADGEARRKMILEEHNKRWLRTSTLLNQQKEKELAEHKADHEKRVKSFEERWSPLCFLFCVVSCCVES